MIKNNPILENQPLKAVLGLCVMLLVPIIFVFYISPNLTQFDKEAKNNSNLKIYNIYLIIANKTPDSLEKTDFINYTTKAMADKKITHKEKLIVEAKYATLIAKNPEQADILTKMSYLKSIDAYKNDVAAAETLPYSSEKEQYLTYAADVLNDGEVTKTEALTMDAKHKTLMSVQEYRQMTVGLKIKEWWQAKHH